MMSDTHTDQDAKSETQVAEIVARCSNIYTYTRFNLSPPMGLRTAAEGWIGLTPDEIVAILRQHLQQHRRSYVCGAGDTLFPMVCSAMRKALETKYPPRDHVDDELERPRRRRAGGVRKVHNVGGRPDAFVEGNAARLVRRPGEGTVEPPPAGLPGYEGSGVPILEDD